MPRLGNEDNVTLNSYKINDEDNKIKSELSPTPTPRTSTPKKDGRKISPPSPKEAEKTISDTLSPILPINLAPQNDESDYVDMPSPERESSNELGESLYAELNLPLAGGSIHGESENTIYATVDFSKKTPKDSSKVDNETDTTLNRSPSQETEFDNPDDLDLDKTVSRLNRKFSRNTTSSLPPSYKTDGSENSLSTDSNFKPQNKKANRILPRVQHAMQQKGVIIFGATAIVFGISAALAYLQDKAKFIAFFTNSPLYVTIPVIAIASLLAISPMFFAIKQFINTKEHYIQKKGADEILDSVLGYQPKDKAIKSVRLKYSNGTHSNFVLNAWESKDDFINIDEKVVNKTNKMESVINNRPLVTTLLTGVVVVNIALPLWLYVQDGINNVQKFYQNPLINNIRLSLLIGSGIFALLAVYLGVHYYRKTNCTNLIYSEGKINAESINKKFIEEIKQERTSVLGENHSKDAKRSSLTLEQVVVQSHNYPDVIYGVGR